ncbi:hypothetical protein EG68_00235 [Paragonimus skrjabini miyazakii]|uniref:NCK adaptor protein n=1 Tax=Paragonimus skrjabini miyazakii TaxID=59628 RepID=A0A8S9Z6J8_9TREM|nr:hypothetical protein EG68_00235 [Paragonimus skrjabini miyazakii]
MRLIQAQSADFTMTEPIRDNLIAKFDYYATESHELTVLEGERLTLLDNSSLWWKVMNTQGEVGYVPSNYVRSARQNLLSYFMNSLSRKKGNIKSKLTGSTTNEWTSRTVEALSLPQPSTKHNRTNATHVEETLQTLMDGRTNEIPSSGMSNPLNTIVRGSKNGVFYSFNRNSLPSGAILMTETNNRDKNIQVPSDNVPAPSIQITTPKHSQVTMNAGPTSSSEVLCRVLVSYTACMSDELSIQAGDRIRVFHKSADGWWFGQLLSNNQNPVIGWFPSSLVVVDSSNVYSSLSHNTLTDIRNDESRTVSTHPTSTSQSISAPPYATEVSAKERVITLYSFDRNQLEELSFEANEILEVIERPKLNGEWWRCRNSRGDVGWVPSNHLRLLRSPQLNTPQHDPQWNGSTEITPPTTQVTLSYGGYEQNSSVTSLQIHSPPVPSDSPNDQRIDGEALRLTHALKSPNASRYIRCPWFWGQISRAECEHMLRHFSKPGEFLIRDSHHVSGNLTITVNAGNVNRNFKILVQNGNYHIGWRTFRSIEDLIEHYRRHYIYTTEQERSSLTRPFVHPGLIPLPGSLLPNYTGPLYSPAFRAYETVFNERWDHTRQATMH